MKFSIYSYWYVKILLIMSIILINIVNPVSASSNDFCFGSGCHSEPDYFINTSMFDNNSHKYLQCIDCHVNVTEYPNATHGNFTNTLTLPLPSSTYNSSDFLLCYGCHNETNIVGLESTYSNSLWTHTVVSGYPLTVLNISTNFVNERLSGHNFGNLPANIHWDHLDLHKIDAGAGPDLIWDSDGDGSLDSMISCPACHDPHGNTSGPNLTREDLGIQHGIDADGEYGEITSIKYQKAGGDLYCVGCHGINVKYYRPNREGLNFSGAHISPVNMASCIQPGCHYSNTLTIEHVEKRNLSCATCHQSSKQVVIDSIAQGNKSCFSCHTPHTGGSHLTHLESAKGPQISCPDCHGAQFPPLFADTQTLENTTVCDTCHSTNGSYDGVNDPDIGARYNWAGVYNDQDGALKPGKEKWCISCHDDVPSNINGEIAPDKAGDNITYGYYITGHGRVSNYTSMSWQDTSATGNPGANRSCNDCHDSGSDHIITGENPGSRLKTGYENDQNNTNCNNCHIPGGMASADPLFYNNSDTFESSVHGGKNCTDCHEVHGAAGQYTGMTRDNKELLCFSCHNSHEGHALSVTFGKGGKTYSLECTSCHNIHIITGMYTADSNKSPVNKFSNNVEVWGDEPGEKMDDFAGSGTYRTPKNDTFDGSRMPDYPTFCLDCHGTPVEEFGSHGGINWLGTHGLMSADSPSGGGTCPNWYGCGKAFGWDGDDCISDEETCWPVMTRGKGDQIFSRLPYNHEERIAGANFVLSCTDCHVVHDNGIGSKIRETVNGGPGSTIHNTLCNDCHYYYSDWHAGMSCGSASCHTGNSLHRMGNMGGPGGIRIFNPDLVADFRFDNNLADSGTWRMHGKWFNESGSFASGKYGSAVVLNGDQLVQVGTTNQYWSTDEGRHGTWKYTEMKYTMTLETWVYPTDSSNENLIFSKHTGFNQGGYALLLAQIDGELKAALQANVNGGVNGSTDCNGIRGAFSTVPVPLNEWTHVAAVFNSSLEDRDTNDLSVGRIRIYVNGEDVTTSYPNSNQCYAQPDTGEDDMFPYSEQSPVNEIICYAGHWCASEFSVGGFEWQNGFIGRIDNTKVWNIAKDSIYFDDADQASPPRIAKAEGAVDSDQVIVTFSEGVWTNTGQSGSLQSGDFTLTDPGSRTIQSVTHSAGSSTATLTLSSPLVYGVLPEITLAAAAGSIFDEYNNSAGTNPVTITCDDCLIISAAKFQFNESAGSTTVTDELAQLTGAVNDPSETLTGDGYFHGDGVDNYIDFENNSQDFKASTSMTLEARIKPTGMEGTENYIKRIFARDQGGNYQMSVWRNNGWTNYNASDGNASIAFWVKPVNVPGGDTAWKPVLTDYDTCPITSDHWYRVKVVWNSSKIGGIPGDIFIDDQGTDGNGTGEIWSGYSNCTDSDQSLLTDDRKLYEGDVITAVDGDFTIGANVNNHANNVFNGLIDWIKWKDEVDYSGVDI